MLKIAVISPNKARMEEIRQILQGGDFSRQVLLFKDGLDQLALVADKEHPDIVILDVISHGTEELLTLEQFGQHYPGSAMIILCENASSEFLVAAIRTGVKDVLPLEAVALQEAVRRIESKLKPVSTSQKMGKVIAFMASKGGSGATFLACNLGYILAATRDVKVALLDLNLQFGDAALFVSDSVPSNTLSDVASNISRLDASFLASSMVQVLPNYGVLAAPEDAERSVEIKPEHIEVLIRLAKSQYDFVIMDIGRTLSATSVKALDHADMIFVVLQETLPFIRDSKRLIHTLQSLGYAKDKIHLILNRYDKGGDIQLDDIEETLGMKMFKTIPNSYEAVSASVNQGVPIMKIYKHNSVTKVLQEVAKNLTTDPKAKSSSWLDSLFQHA
ncbi:MAG: AAA family ATPase [Methylotenera sp.]|nr:AAA family ATPase [Methylotenera sp.]MDO9232510.1 AAA family ATPase [Methylotenera sp.]MDO9388757.1 AAA family ATPase [Methylotenera sp.]MDP2403531.1 AAA family ATPase [Methylotenera sp.]MDP3095644.1 AAA family ATPase [Methylotenera sp.]